MGRGKEEKINQEKNIKIVQINGNMNFKESLFEAKLTSHDTTSIPHLKNLSNSDIDIILDSYITISEKIDGMKFSIIKTNRGKVEYWSKNFKIDKAMLILNSNWSLLIQRLENLRRQTNNFKMLPNNSEIAGEFLREGRTNNIFYKKGIRGDWVIYYARIGEKVYKAPQYKNLWYWSDYFQSQRLSILFSGKLSNDQKIKIKEFTTSSDEERLKRFQTENFPKYILDIVNPTLNISDDKVLEGIIFYSDNRVFKIIDPVFTVNNKEQWDTYNQERDGLKKELIDLILNILSVKVISNIRSIYGWEIRQSSPEDRYIFLINKIFNFIISTKKKELSNIHLKYGMADLDTSLNMIDLDSDIKNKIHDNKLYRVLYEFLLYVFKNKKIRKGIFKDVDIDKFNNLISAVNMI